MTRPGVVTLGRPGAAWPRAVAGWAAHAELAARVTTCVDPVDLRGRLDADTPPPVLALADLGYWRTDPGLATAARVRGVTAVAVSDGAIDDDHAVGTTPTSFEILLPADFGSAHLARILAAADRRRPVRDLPVRDRATPGPPPGRLVVVTGPTGAGASTVAQALATHLAAAVPTVLADLALDADQHVRHGIPGDGMHRTDLTETLAATAPDDPLPTVAVGAGYALLTGGTRVDGPDVPAPVATAALDGLRRRPGIVVADVGAGALGPPLSRRSVGDDRHPLASAALAAADEVVVVGDCSTTGIHRLASALLDLGRSGIPRPGIRPVLNRVPGPRPRRRALAEEVARLLDLVDGDGWAVPACLPYDRRIEPAVRRAGPLPTRFVRAAGPVAGRPATAP